VSGDAAVAPVAEEYGALMLPDRPGGGLNGSLQGACAWLGAACPDHAALLVPADLPAITPAVLESAVFVLDAAVVIARSADGGTNLLLQQPPAALQLSFGPGSCARHRAAAVAAGRRVAVIDHPVIAQDIDTPDDLTAFLARPGAGRTGQLLHRLRVPDRLAATVDTFAP
jgi:2-phospho-L-lactate guanylyltransferase